MDVLIKPILKLVYFNVDVVIHFLILYCLTVRSVISLGTLGPNASGSHLRTLTHCLARTKVDISYPSNETWWYDSQDLNVPVLRHPIAVGYAASTADVQALVKCAVEHGIRISPRSGGHSYEAFSNEDDHLVIDVSRIDYIKFNDGPHTVSVGGGIRVASLYYALGRRRKTFPGSVCQSVGLAGQVAAGGQGYLTRMWGVAADNVLELEMVDYRGRVLVANRKTNPDLFFALRGGGGGSYGIVVRMKLKVYPYPKLTTAFSFQVNYSIETSEISRAWFEWAPWHTLPREMSLHLEFGQTLHLYGLYLGEDGPVGLERILEASGFLNLVPKGSRNYRYYSSKDNLEVRAWMDNDDTHYGNEQDYHIYNVPSSFIFNRLDLPPYPYPVHETWAQIQNDPRVNATHPYGAIGTTGPISNMEPRLSGHSYPKKSSHTFVKEFDEAAFQALDEFRSHDGTLIRIKPSGGILYSTPEDFNAYPHRHDLFTLQYRVLYHPIGTRTPSGFQEQEQILHKALTAMEPYTNHMSYQGYADLYWTTDPKIYMPRYYGNNVARLVRAKRTYDPDDFFKNKQSTPTSI